MIDRDLCEPFQIDADAYAYVRDYIEGELARPILMDWSGVSIEVLKALPDGWRVRLAMKITHDKRGREVRLPVLLVESENLP